MLLQEKYFVIYLLCTFIQVVKELINNIVGYRFGECPPTRLLILVCPDFELIKNVPS